MEFIVIMNCILFIAFIGWYNEHEKMHGVSDIMFNWVQEEQIFAASVGGPDLFKC